MPRTPWINTLAALTVLASPAMGQERDIEAPSDDASVVNPPPETTAPVEPDELLPGGPTDPPLRGVDAAHRRSLRRVMSLAAMPVRDADGERRGILADLVIDTRNGSVSHILVKPDDPAREGFLPMPAVLTDYSSPLRGLPKRTLDAPAVRKPYVTLRSQRNWATDGPIIGVDGPLDADIPKWVRETDDYYAEDVDVFYDTIGHDTDEILERARHIEQRAIEIERKARRSINGDPIEERIRERVENNILDSEDSLRRERAKRPPVRSLDTLDELEDDR